MFCMVLPLLVDRREPSYGDKQYGSRAGEWRYIIDEMDSEINGNHL